MSRAILFIIFGLLILGMGFAVSILLNYIVGGGA